MTTTEADEFGPGGEHWFRDELTDDFVDDLLKPDPIQWFDTEMRCAERGCSAPTYIKLEGIPRCIMHTIYRCNELLKRGGDNDSNSTSEGKTRSSTGE